MPSLPSAGIIQNGVHPQIRLRVLVLSLNVGRCGQGRRRAATSSLAPAIWGSSIAAREEAKVSQGTRCPASDLGRRSRSRQAHDRRWAPDAQHEPRGGPEFESVRSGRDRRLRKGVWPFEAATRDGRSAQILFSNGVKAGGSSRCRRFRAPAFSACSFGT
jgi:hypothetical protein